MITFKLTSLNGDEQGLVNESGRTAGTMVVTGKTSVRVLAQMKVDSGWHFYIYWQYYGSRRVQVV